MRGREDNISNSIFNTTEGHIPWKTETETKVCVLTPGQHSGSTGGVEGWRGGVGRESADRRWCFHGVGQHEAAGHTANPRPTCLRGGRLHLSSHPHLTKDCPHRGWIPTISRLTGWAMSWSTGSHTVTSKEKILGPEATGTQSWPARDEALHITSARNALDPA